MFFDGAKPGNKFFMGDTELEIFLISLYDDGSGEILAGKNSRRPHECIKFFRDGSLEKIRFGICVCSWTRPTLTKEKPSDNTICNKCARESCDNNPEEHILDCTGFKEYHRGEPESTNECLTESEKAIAEAMATKIADELENTIALYRYTYRTGRMNYFPSASQSQFVCQTEWTSMTWEDALYHHTPNTLLRRGRKKCPVCDGFGHNHIRGVRCPYCDGKKQDDCVTCGGTGKVDSSDGMGLLHTESKTIEIGGGE